MSEHLLGGSVVFTRLSPCKVLRVTFLNGAGDAQGITLSNGSLPSTQPVFTLKGSAGISSAFDIGGYPFRDGFTATPTASTVTDIIIEYEDI